MMGKNSEQLKEIAKVARGLAIDTVQKANSGHPGGPLGQADIYAYLWYEFMNYNPNNPKWLNRDRFILSAGHCSAGLYTMLHLSGYKVSLDDLKSFRQMDSNTPGHPESHETPGVENTTGPLGQGFGNSVGIALGMKILESRYNRPDHQLLDPKVICIVGDGCMMEGISHEVMSFAGHLNLNNLICIYDYNNITLDDHLEASCTDDIISRCKSHGWDVKVVEDGHDFAQIEKQIGPLREKQEKPTMVIVKTVIGFGSPKAGTNGVHGSPLGDDGVKETKKNIGLPEDQTFFVSDDAKKYFKEKQASNAEKEETWNASLRKWREAYPQLSKLFDQMEKQSVDAKIKEELRGIEFPDSVAGRKVSNKCLATLMEHCPWMVGGSADLSVSDCTLVKEKGIIATNSFEGANIKYGIREFGMATIANGMALDHLRPFCGTFFTFSDYMRNAVRLASLSSYPVMFVYTHDSIGLGEDGPTHQPIEQLASLRAMPNLVEIRPADEYECKAAYWWAINYTGGPVAMIFSRQNLPRLQGSEIDFDDTVGKGAYILMKEKGNKPDVTLFSTGSEVHIAVKAAEGLIAKGKNVRVVSMPSWTIFERQSKEYQEKVVGGDLGLRVSVEAGAKFGWERYVGRDGLIIGLETYGKSAPAEEIYEHFGITPEAIISKITSHAAGNVRKAC